MSEKMRESTWDRHGVIGGLLKDIALPKMARVRQVFDSSRITDIPAAVREQVARPEIRGRVRKGARIAVTVGSRGIANLPVLVRALVGAIREAGGDPFVVPAMGSHGGATAEGQLEVLAGMGVCEEAIGAPIRASMDTVVAGRTPEGKPVYLDRIASQADGIVVFGRIKPHTAFRGPHESGLYKMMAIGLGNQRGAEAVHAEGFGRMGANVPAYARVTLATGKIVFGMAVVENAFDDTCLVEAMPPDQIAVREPVLLEESKRLMPHLKFDPVDVLVCDQIGKNFSGDGMDPNITASYITPYATGGPRVERYVILDLSEESHGNAIGTGVAHFTTKRVFDKTDFDATYPNALTCRVVLGARMPLVVATDRMAIQGAVYTVTEGDASRPRIVRIANTSHVDEIEVSENLLDEARGRSDIEILEGPRDWPFDGDGNLFPA
jgi:hypothetical protein